MMYLFLDTSEVKEAQFLSRSSDARLFCSLFCLFVCFLHFFLFLCLFFVFVRFLHFVSSFFFLISSLITVFILFFHMLPFRYGETRRRPDKKAIETLNIHTTRYTRVFEKFP